MSPLLSAAACLALVAAAAATLVLTRSRAAARLRALEAELRGRSADLERSEARFRSLVEHASDVITVIGPGGDVRYETPSTRTVLGATLVELGARPQDVVHPDDLPRVVAAARDLAGRPGAETSVECRVRHRDGRWRQVEAFAANRLDDEAVGGYVVSTRDITERKALDEQLTHRAFHDPLTGLANRALFTNRLEHAVGRSVRHGQSVGVLFLDLDDFKHVNDTLGHGAGDELLSAIARRLDGCVRPLDTVARLGGDEFALLLDELDDVLEVGHVAERVLAAIAPPFRIDGREVFVRGSIGMATATKAHVTADELVRNADAAMYTAKARGKGGYELFESGMHAALVERLELEGDLRSALERDEFELHYQPVVSLPEGEPVAVEALVRWRHPRLGMIAPGRFIHIAEQAGLIVPIGCWVLSHACRQAAAWRERFAELRLNVNLSARQLQDAALADDVSQALSESGLEPRALVLEVTESLVVADPETAVARLEGLRELGVGLALDDYGTGQSSLADLRMLPLDGLKIDRAFIEGLYPGSERNSLTHSIVAMGHSLGLVVVAEGVEDGGQASALAEMGCDLAQGYHFGRPTEGANLEAWLERRAAALS